MVLLQKLWWMFVTQLFLRLRFRRIGWRTYVAAPIFIFGGRNITIGRNVRIFPHSRFEAHDRGGIVIEDDVSVGQNFHITSSGMRLVVGSHTTISANVLITNIDHEYREIGKHILNQPFLVRKTAIGENCFIGAGVMIQAGTVLGKQCIVGANSVVRGVFPDYCVIVGAPARIVKRYDPQREGWYKTDNKGMFVE